jgi:hypothetical protein
MSTSKRPDEGLPLAERGQAFLQSARALRGLSSDQIARIARRLDAPHPRGQRRSLLHACAAAALLLTASAAVAWASGALDRLPGWGALFGQGKRDSPPLARAVPRSPSEPGKTAPAAAPEVGSPPALSGSAQEPTTDAGRRIPAPSDETQSAPTRPAHRARRAMTRPMAPGPAPRPEAPPAEPSAEPAESLIVLEGRSFGQVLELWRARRDGTAALSALDAHDRRFAGGQMGTEALVLRAEILLAGRREREGLAALDRVPLDNAPRGRELRTVRGELRVRFDRCEDARLDLAVVARGADGYAARARAALVRCP